MSDAALANPWLDTLLGAIARPPARAVLVSLEAMDETDCDRDRLIAALTDRTDTAADDWERDLYHQHLPVLAELGLVEYDWDAGVIHYRSCESVSTLLETVEELAQAPARPDP